MARPREFDETIALEAAMNCFWQRGYEATSVRDLADEMGISAPSLYNAYGDKRALFVQALERYLEQSTRARIKRLENSLPPKQAVRQFLDDIIKRSVNDRERRGCFLINSALEVAPHDKELGALIADRLAEIEAFFTDQSRPRKRREPFRGAAPRRISHACCSASSSASGCLLAPNRNALCLKASRGQLWRFSIELPKHAPEKRCPLLGKIMLDASFAHLWPLEQNTTAVRRMTGYGTRPSFCEGD
jgi:AcrR family transcriptional regulator